MPLQLIRLPSFAEQRYHIDLGVVLPDPHARRWLQHMSNRQQKYMAAATDLVRRSRLDEYATASENRLEIGLIEMLLNLDSPELILVFLRFCSLLDSTGRVG